MSQTEPLYDRSDDESKTAKPMVEQARNYALGALVILIVMAAIAFIGGIVWFFYTHHRPLIVCDDGNPTTNDFAVAGGCLNIFAGIGARCVDRCIVEAAGTVALSPSTRQPFCNGTSRGQCSSLNITEIAVECEPIGWVSLVTDHLANFTSCGYGRCLYGVVIPPEALVGQVVEWSNEETMAEKLNDFCMEFVDDAFPYKSCLHASFLPAPTNQSQLCGYSFRNANMDFDLINQIFSEPVMFRHNKAGTKTTHNIHKAAAPPAGQAQRDRLLHAMQAQKQQSQKQPSHKKL